MNNEEKILTMLEKHSKMLEHLVGDVAELKTIQARQGETLITMNGRLDTMDGRLDTMDGRLDTMDGRLDTIEGRLDTMDGRLDELDDRSLRSAVMLENEIGPKVQLLYEGQALLKEKMDMLAPKDRVEALEDDMSMLKDVVKLMRQEINELKKAQ